MSYTTEEFISATKVVGDINNVIFPLSTTTNLYGREAITIEEAIPQTTYNNFPLYRTILIENELWYVERILIDRHNELAWQGD